MSTPTTSSYDWIREIKPEIKDLDAIPLTGSAPPFPWDQLGERLSQSFEQSPIEITPGEITWRTKDQLYEGLGDNPSPLIFAIPSLSGSVAWVIPEQEIASLESLLLTKEDHPLTFQDRALGQAFYRFLALEVLYNISQLHFDKSLVPILTTQTALPEEDSLCWDLSITIREQTFWGRLVISQELRRSWIEHVSKIAHSSTLSQEMARRAEALVHLEVGRTNLSFEQWSNVHIGDWVQLDQFSLESDFLSGRVMLTVHGKNAFIGRLKEGNIKIVEFPLYHEVETPMAKNTQDEDDFDDFDLTDHGEEFDLDESFDATEDLLEEDLTTEETSSTSTPSSIPKTPTPSSTQADVAAPQKDASTTRLAPKDIPVSMIVELGRVQMTMEKLMLLEPGNLLDLNINPENGVDLVINSRIVGRGELIRIGESIGVRILELGH